MAVCNFEIGLHKCIRMGQTFNFARYIIGWIYGRKLRFIAPLARRCKTKYPTVYVIVYMY